MPNQPKPGNVPICFRPGTKPGDPDGDRAWLKRYSKETERPVGELVSEAVAEYRARRTTTKPGRTTTGATTPVAAKPPRPRAGRKTEVKSSSEEKTPAGECEHGYPDVKNVAGVRVCRKCG